MYTYTYMYSITIREKAGDEFEGKWGREYGMVCRLETEGRDRIELESQK